MYTVCKILNQVPVANLEYLFTHRCFYVFRYRYSSNLVALHTFAGKLLLLLLWSLVSVPCLLVCKSSWFASV